MKVSARNQFEGVITAMKVGPTTEEVQMTTAGGVRITAVIPHESSLRWGLALGAPIVMIVKAEAVILVTDAGGMKFTALNRLDGTVVSLRPDVIMTEVEVEVPGGVRVVAVVTRGGTERLGLEVGAPVTALFKGWNVLVGVAR